MRLFYPSHLLAEHWQWPYPSRKTACSGEPMGPAAPLGYPFRHCPVAVLAARARGAAHRNASKSAASRGSARSGTRKGHCCSRALRARASSGAATCPPRAQSPCPTPQTAGGPAPRSRSPPARGGRRPGCRRTARARPLPRPPAPARSARRCTAAAPLGRARRCGRAPGPTAPAGPPRPAGPRPGCGRAPGGRWPPEAPPRPPA